MRRRWGSRLSAAEHDPQTLVECLEAAASTELDVIRRALDEAPDADAVRRHVMWWLDCRYRYAATPDDLDQLAADLRQLQLDPPDWIEHVERVAELRRPAYESLWTSLRPYRSLLLVAVTSGLMAGMSTFTPAAKLTLPPLLLVLGLTAVIVLLRGVDLRRVRRQLRLEWRLDAEMGRPHLEQADRQLRDAVSWALHAPPRLAPEAALARRGPRPRASRAAARRAQGPRSGADPGEGDPEPADGPAAAALTLALRPAAIYAYGCLPCEQRGADVEQVVTR